MTTDYGGFFMSEICGWSFVMKKYLKLVRFFFVCFRIVREVGLMGDVVMWIEKWFGWVVSCLKD